MQIIPVIDIKRGVVVHARAGDRASYRPIETPLAEGHEPLAVIAGLLSLFPFDTLYVADLDGIEAGAPDEGMQQRILDRWPGSRVLIDDGRRSVDGCHSRRRAVAGSESMIAIADLARADVLSLDFRGDTFLGPGEVLERVELWPREVIVMELSAVGTGSGPHLPRLRDIIERSDGRAIFAAGGVRTADHLRLLRTVGVEGALVATALHNGQIKARDLEEIAG